MAQIREYVAPSGEELRPSETGERALVQAGRILQFEGNQAAAGVRRGTAELGHAIATYGELADKHASFQEITNGASSFAALRNATDAIANQAFKDPSQNTDPALGAKINSQVQPMVDKWADSFTTDRGRQWALEQATRYKEAFQTRLAADTSTMAGLAADKHLNDWMTSASNIVERDPTALAQEKGMVGSTIDALVDTMPGLSAADAAKFRDEHSAKMLQQLDTVALNKLALSAPGAARSMYDAGKFGNVDPVHAEQILKMGDSVARQNAAADRANQRFAEEERNDRLMSSTVQNIGQMTVAAQKGDPNALQRLKDYSTQILIDGTKNGMKGTSAWQAHEMALQSIQKLSMRSDVPTDQSTLADIHTKMLDPNGPQVTASDIVKENLEGKLSNEDTHDLVGMLNLMKSDPATQTYMKQFQDSLTDFEPLIKGAQSAEMEVPGLGAYRYREFMNDHLKLFQTGIQQGIAAKDLLDPTNTNYIFKDLKDYMVTPQNEESVFGKPFTLSDQTDTPIPASVRFMEAYRAQQQAQKDRQTKMDALTGVNIQEREEIPPPGSIGGPEIPQ